MARYRRTHKSGYLPCPLVLEPCSCVWLLGRQTSCAYEQPLAL
jgi:hypothetical protein